MECRYFTKFKWPCFGTVQGSHMVGHAGSSTCIVHVAPGSGQRHINMHNTCWYDLDQGQRHGAFKFPKIVENCWILHFSRSLSCAILAWSSKLIVDRDRTAPNLKWPCFCTAGGCGHMVGYGGSPICIAHTDVTLTWSKVKVKVTDLLKFRKLQFSTSTSAVSAWRWQLMGDYDSMGPSL